MNHLKTTALLFFFVLPAILFSQETILPQKLRFLGPIEVSKPIRTDADSAEKKNQGSNPLFSPLTFPAHSTFEKEIAADKTEIFKLPHFATEKDALYLVSFFIHADSYVTGEITVTTPFPFQVFMDGAKISEKTTQESNPKDLRYIKTRFNANTGGARVVMKLFVPSSHKSDAAFRISVSATDSSSLTLSDNEKRRITINDILEGKRVNSVAISPNGRFTLIRLSETLPGGKTLYFTEVYDNKNERIILSEPTSRSQLRWMPKTDLLSYVSESENGVSLFSLNPLTSEQKILAQNLPSSSFIISPDEKSLFYIEEKKVEKRHPYGLKRMQAPDDRQPNYGRTFHIFRYDMPTGFSQQITSGNTSAELHGISPDARLLLFSTTTETPTETPFYNKSMFCVDWQTMQVDTLWTNEKYTDEALFSPDGSQILIKGSPQCFNHLGSALSSGKTPNSYDKQAYVMTLKTKHIEPITKSFAPGIDAMIWSASDNQIYLRTQDKDRKVIYCYHPQKRTFSKLPVQEEYISAFDVSQSAPMAAYAGSGASNSTRAYLYSLKKEKSSLISAPYDTRLEKLQLGEVKDWNFKNTQGVTVDGRYYLPPYFDPNKKYPLIVYYYGGASPAPRTFENAYPLHVYAARGYVVYVLQPAGTVGYGQEFSSAFLHSWGNETVNDIIRGTQLFAKEHAFIDREKIGCIGASYGGFITQLMQTQTDIFATAVSHAGISNIAGYWGEGHWGYTYGARKSPNSYPWNNRSVFVDQSPIFNADKIRTPLLLLHGTDDTNVPIGESMQMYLALKILGKPVEFIQVEKENHVIADYRKIISWNHAIYAWFDKWLKNDSKWWDSMFPKN
ncbi:MAG: prolyl oligopeptidase family serine peptidase [Bacteroidia bacterium]|nr:prolyl oligopeptidase family serine peptidase [Bacteroidia bacterium]